MTNVLMASGNQMYKKKETDETTVVQHVLIYMIHKGAPHSNENSPPYTPKF
jgi:hypothetical protein